MKESTRKRNRTRGFVAVGESTYALLKAAAEVQNKSMAQIVEEALEGHLPELPKRVDPCTG